MAEARCVRCGRPLTNPVSIALGIGPVCRGKTGARNSSLDSSFPSYDRRNYSAFHGNIPLGQKTKARYCGCEITMADPDLLGIVFARECYEWCCKHCREAHEGRCSLEALRTEGLVRAYDLGDGLYCLGYWFGLEAGFSTNERIWAAYWDGEKLEKRNLAGKTVLVCKVGNLPAAQFIATQILPLKA